MAPRHKDRRPRQQLPAGREAGEAVHISAAAFAEVSRHHPRHLHIASAGLLGQVLAPPQLDRSRSGAGLTLRNGLSSRNSGPSPPSKSSCLGVQDTGVEFSQLMQMALVARDELVNIPDNLYRPARTGRRRPAAPTAVRLPRQSLADAGHYRAAFGSLLNRGPDGRQGMWIALLGPGSTSNRLDICGSAQCGVSDDRQPMSPEVLICL